MSVCLACRFPIKSIYTNYAKNSEQVAINIIIIHCYSSLQCLNMIRMCIKAGLLPYNNPQIN